MSVLGRVGSDRKGLRKRSSRRRLGGNRTGLRKRHLGRALGVCASKRAHKRPPAARMPTPATAAREVGAMSDSSDDDISGFVSPSSIRPSMRRDVVRYHAQEGDKWGPAGAQNPKGENGMRAGRSEELAL